MAAQLDALDIDWERVDAIDAQDLSQAQIERLVAPPPHRVRMELGSRCSAATVLSLFRRLVDQGHAAVAIMEDDISIAPDLRLLLKSSDWIPKDIGLIQLEKYGRRRSLRLLGPANYGTPLLGRELRRLHSRTGGAACYIITRPAIEKVLACEEELNVPLDHFLFSPNLSPVFREIGVAVITPALARQNNERLESDIRESFAKAPKTTRERLTRLYFELNRVPGQLVALARGARFRPFEFRFDSGADD